jgi:hypothetical protein
MAFGLTLPDFPAPEAALEDDPAAWSVRLSQQADAACEELQLTIERSEFGALLDAPVFEGSLFRSLAELAGLGGVQGTPELRNLDDLAALAARLPPELAGPDATGEVPTGSAAIGREALAVAATLSAAARIVTAIGPQAETIETRGLSFTVGERYVDAESGFSAVLLTPEGGGPVVFSVDGLQVGSRADEVAAATLGRLQVESNAFRAMIADAVQFGAGEGVVFAGPSLGGAVAQVAAYETAEALRGAGAQVATGDVRLVTVDPLGGADAARAINGGVLDPAVLALIEAVNIRTEGDIVSRIGSHLGATLTFPARDEQGQEVQLSAAEAHVNVLSLLQNLSSDAFFAEGAFGPPAEIAGFALASNAAADEAIALWRAFGAEEEEVAQPLQITGTASLDPARTTWSLDADDNGSVDLAVLLSSPLDPGRDALVLT